MKMLETIKDAWINAMTGKGFRSRDKSTHSRFVSRAPLDHVTLDALYTQSGLAARIVDRSPDDETREPFTLEGADESFDWKSVNSQLEDLKVRTHLGDARRWSRLYGASLLYPEVIDGIDPREPLNLAKVRGLGGIEVIESRYAVPVIGPGSLSLTRPERYAIMTPDNQVVREVHHTRVFRFDGTRVPRSVLVDNGGWPTSALDRLYEQLLRLGDAHSNAGALLHVMSQPVLKMANLRKMLLDGGKERKEIADLIEGIQQAASALGWVTVDAADTFEVVVHPVEGLVKLLDKFVDDLAINTGLPREILLNKTEGGLNTGENAGPFRSHYDQVAKDQEQYLTPAINWLLEIIFAIREKSNETRPEEWTVKFEPLWQMSEAERAEIDNKKAQTYATHYQIGTIEPAEIRQAEFVKHQPIDLSEKQPQGEPLDLDLPEPPADGPAGPAIPASTTVLNPEQATSLMAIVEKVHAGALPRDAALTMITLAYPVDAAMAEGLLGSAGMGAPGQPGAIEAPQDAEPEPSPHAPPAGEQLMSPKAIAEELGCSAASVRGMHRRGEIEGWKIGGRWRFAKSQVLTASHRSNASPAEEAAE